MSPHQALRLLVLLLLSSLLGACSLGYYWQAASGHLSLMNRRQAVAALLADEKTPAVLKARLRLAVRAREFAQAQLGLPDGGSYRHYAQLDGDYVVWNVVAAPELSLEPRSWCYPVAGCVTYRGYFDERDARRFADQASARGDDVLVAGVRAYSTLGRFNDPLLSSFMKLPDHRLAGLIFHELAHQKIYVQDDPAFNEAFATAVERQGLLLWLREDRDQRCQFELWLDRLAAAKRLLAKTRAELAAIYASEGLLSDQRAAKAAALAALTSAYGRLRATWSAPPYFDAWFHAPSNASLAALATYDGWVPAFVQLMGDSGHDWQKFYAEVDRLAALSADKREREMSALLNRAQSAAEAFSDCPKPSHADSFRGIAAD